MSRRAEILNCTDKEKQQLEKWVNGAKGSVRHLAYKYDCELSRLDTSRPLNNSGVSFLMIDFPKNGILSTF